MVNYILDLDNRSVIVGVDENFKVNVLKRSYYDVDYSWYVDKEGILTYNDKIYELKEGDIVLLMYGIREVDENGRDLDKAPIGELIVISKDSQLGDYCNRKREAFKKREELRKLQSTGAETCCDKVSC